MGWFAHCRAGAVARPEDVCGPKGRSITSHLIIFFFEKKILFLRIFIFLLKKKKEAPQTPKKKDADAPQAPIFFFSGFFEKNNLAKIWKFWKFLHFYKPALGAAHIFGSGYSSSPAVCTPPHGVGGGRLGTIG